jgi:hypothetical protein
LPFVVYHLIASQRTVWACCSALLGAVYLFNFALAARRARRLRGTPGPAIHRGLQTLFQGGSLVFGLVLGMNAVGVGLSSQFGPYLAGLAWLLVISGVMFFRLLVGIRGPGSSSP